MAAKAECSITGRGTRLIRVYKQSENLVSPRTPGSGFPSNVVPTWGYTLIYRLPTPSYDGCFDVFFVVIDFRLWHSPLNNSVRQSSHQV